MDLTRPSASQTPAPPPPAVEATRPAEATTIDLTVGRGVIKPEEVSVRDNDLSDPPPIYNKSSSLGGLEEMRDGGGAASGGDRGGADRGHSGKTLWAGFAEQMETEYEEGAMHMALELRNFYEGQADVFLGVFYSRGRPAKATNPVHDIIRAFLARKPVGSHIESTVLFGPTQAGPVDWHVLGRTESFTPGEERVRDESGTVVVSK